ncbi:tryptophan synthase subunit alpha [Rufibacter glacialis]|uniref:Tryptophan synthase alpha chain n=1 Tax=Rufibacter glacialis TaxID=1259555 RepID=A0A5M8QEI7_9BACT|nr:tryptophan synthase subunit alpha [Rufibacter glacialis]KAA6434455.1 tryptophan synthase subunit alpha [Rufibacter glacialis]GGK69783.1 tryptophan synthase alpha chain [Rufibacter glacialis]
MPQNRLTRLFQEKSGNLLNIYFTAGYPKLEDTVTILEELEAAGADLVEIGMPFSDPLADGPTIQASNQVALENGMSIKMLLSQLAQVRERVSFPIILMGYLNPVMQYGFERFCEEAARVGVDGLILPDLPFAEYEEEYKPVLEKHGLSLIFLITPQTSEARIRQIDGLTNSFIYMVSSASTTGSQVQASDAQQAYYAKVRSLGLKNPVLIGFGISDKPSFELACQSAHGAIIGSAFIKALQKPAEVRENVRSFLKTLR